MKHRRISILSLALSLCLLLTALPALAEDVPHTHQWEQGEGYEATCTDTGYIQEICSICGETRWRDIPAKGHYFPNPWTTIKEPTCTETGVEMNTCVRENWPDYFPCGYEWWRDIPPLGHEWGEWYVVKAPKPGEDGIEERECVRCGETEQRPASVHAEYALSLKAVIAEQKTTYSEGETVSVDLTITNEYDVDVLIERLRQVNPDFSVIDFSLPVGDTPLKPGESRQFAATYTTSTEDEENGFAKLEFEARGYDPENFEGYDDYVISNRAELVLNLDPFMNYEVIIVKNAIYPPANGEYYVEGEKIDYSIRIMGRFNRHTENVSVYERPDDGGDLPNNGLLDEIKWLEPFEERNYSAHHVVTALDCARGYYINRAYVSVKEAGGRYAECRVPCGNDPITDIRFEVTSEPQNGSAYARTETITYQAIFTNNLDTPLSDVKIYDFDGNRLIGEVDELAPHDSVSFSCEICVDQQDCIYGYVTNKALARFKANDERYGGLEEVESLPVTVLTVFDENELHMDASEAYRTGADVTVHCALTNNSVHEIYVEYAFCAPPESDPVIVHEPCGAQTLKPGETREFDMIYTILEEDLYTGFPIKLVNYARGYSPVYEKDDVYSNSAYVYVVDQEEDIGDMELWVQKSETSVPDNGEYYVEGETIEYLIEVWNCQGWELYNVEIYDLPGEDEDAKVLLANIPVVGPHEIFEYTYSHEVTGEDIENGTYVNGAMGIWDSSQEDTSDPEYERVPLYATPVESPCSDKNDGLRIIKRIKGKPINGMFYHVGEEIAFEISLINKSGHDLIEYSIHDTNLSAPFLNPPTGGFGLLKNGETKTISFVYKVEKVDVLMGAVLSKASCEWQNELGEKGVLYTRELEVPTGIGGADEQSGVTILKSVLSVPVNTCAYAVGETVIYEVKITNCGSSAVTDVELADPIKGGNEDSVIDRIECLGAGESRAYVIDYTVNEEDAAVGYVVNQAVALWTDGETGENVSGVSNVVTVPVLHRIAAAENRLSVYKIELSVPANGIYYTEGETVSYGVYVVNESDALQDYITLYDDLYGEGKELGNLALEAGQTSETFTFEHAVTREDVERGFIQNQAYVLSVMPGDVDNDIEVRSNSVMVRTGESDPDDDPVLLTLTKAVVSAPANGEYYTEGETVAYLVTLTNNSSRTVTVDRAFDSMYSGDGLIDQVLLETGVAEPYGSFSAGYTYTVGANEVAAGSATNYVEMTLHFTDGDGEEEKRVLTDAVTVALGEGSAQTLPALPAVIMYEVSRPENGGYYTVGEDVEYDVWVYNYGGSAFTNAEGYDILLPESAYLAETLGTLGDTPVKLHVKYTVTEIDELMESVYNIAWITLYDTEKSEWLTLYSNEVIVPTGGTVVATDKSRTFCERTLAAEGEGAKGSMTVYCAEHASVQAAADKVLGGEASESAYELALNLWLTALDSEYEELIRKADEKTGAALSDDRLIFTAYLDTYRARLEAQGVSADEITARLIDLIRDRVCGLCGASSVAPEARKDRKSAAAASACEIVYGGNAAQYTKSVGLCDAHASLFDAAWAELTAGDEGAYEKACAYLSAELDALYDKLIANAEPMTRHLLLKEKAALLGCAKAQRNVYLGLYPGDETLAGELALRLLEERIASLCD